MGGGGGPPPKPSFAPGAFSDGSYVVVPDGSTRRDGYERNGTTTYFGGGLFPPYSGTLSVGGSGTLVTLRATKTPVATAQVTASNAGNGNRPAQGDLALGYSVVIHAANAAANALTPFLSHSGALAAASGFVTLDATGQAFSQGAVRTGVPSALAVPLQKVVYFACDPTGYTRLGTAGCGTHAYSIDVNFVNGSAFGNGDPLDFIGSITLEASVHAGPTGLGAYVGSGSAYVDPTITFASFLNSPLYSVSLGGGSVAGAGFGGTGAVPEPASWAMMLFGFGLTGIVARLAARRSVVLA